MRTIPNGDGSVRPDVPRPVMLAIGLLFRWLWRLIPPRTLCAACNYTRGQRVSGWHRVILWVHGQYPLWDQEVY